MSRKPGYIMTDETKRKIGLANSIALKGDNPLHIHHIDYDKKNCNPDNLIALCHSCHMQTNHHREFWKNYFKHHAKR
jgi:hypothetical protein